MGFVNFLFSLLNTPCLELIGTVPGSAITTMPTISWCSWNNVCERTGLFRSRWKKLDLIQSTSRTTLVTSGTRSRASFSPPSSSATTTSRFVHVNTALQRILFVKPFFPSEYNLSPFCDLLVCPENWVFDVDGVISHASQDQGLVKSPHYKHCVVVLWEERGLVMNGKPRVSYQQHLILKKHIVPPSLPMASVLLRNPR